MVFESVKKAVDSLNASINDTNIGQPMFHDKRFKPINFSAKNFRILSLNSNKRRIAYVDGGNSEILSAPNFSVQMTRICYNIFENNKRLNPKSVPNKIEFFTLCYAEAENEKISYKTKIIPLEYSFTKFLPCVEDLQFNSFDRTLMNGSQRASVSTAGESSRRFAEWKIAAKIIESELDNGDILVRDGSLQTPVTNENKYAEMAYKSAVEKGVVFTGLSKTSEIFTTTGYSLLGAIKKMSIDNGLNQKDWAYYPIVISEHPDHRADMFIVKLNPNASHIFRFEIFKEQADKMSETEKADIISTLAGNSSDISFLGYPYGLLLTDINARVRGEEMNCLRLLFMSEITKPESKEKFLGCMNASNAHDILNKF